MISITLSCFFIFHLYKLRFATNFGYLRKYLVYKATDVDKKCAYYDLIEQYIMNNLCYISIQQNCFFVCFLENKLIML